MTENGERGDVETIQFPETAFYAVTAYQNDQVNTVTGRVPDQYMHPKRIRILRRTDGQRVSKQTDRLAEYIHDILFR